MDVVKIQLLHQVRPVVFGCLYADVQLLRHFLGRVALRDQLQDLPLPRSQDLDPGARRGARIDHRFAQQLGDIRTEVAAAVGHDVDPFFQFAQRRRLFHEAVRSGLKKLADQMGVLVAAEHQNPGVLEML